MFISASAKIFSPYNIHIHYTHTSFPSRSFDFDFDFKILTAFIRLGRARPVGAGCPP